MSEQFEPNINQEGLAILDSTSSVQIAQRLYEEASHQFQQGSFNKAEILLLKTEEQLNLQGNFPNLIKVLLLLGTLKREQGELDDASKYFAKTRDIARRLGDKYSEADALNLEASVLSYQGHDFLAIKNLKEALNLIKDSDQIEKELNLYCNIGSIYIYLGDYPMALSHLTQAHELANCLSKPSKSKAIILSELGKVYKEINDIKNAIHFQTEARKLAVFLQDVNIETSVLNNLADLRLLQGNLMEAKSLYNEALNIAQKVGNTLYIIDNLSGLGSVYKMQQDYQKAIQKYSQALELAKVSGKNDIRTGILLSLGVTYLLLKNYKDTENILLEALALAKELEHLKAIYQAHELLAQVYERSADFSKALYHHKEFHRVEKLIFNSEADKRTKQLSVQFELERIRHEAEEYRLRTEIAQEARHEAEVMVLERTHELEEAHLEIVTRLAVAAEYRDDDTGDHTKRVGRNAAAIAHTLGWSQEDCKLLFTAARLHDVGKIGIADAILLKPGKLTAEEFETIKQHPIIGGRILANGQTQLLKLAEEIALYHHERWDGKGYPFKLSGEAIPIAARIVAVADVFDALSHERSYKRAWPLEETLAEIKRQSGMQFDPEVVEACLQIFAEPAKLLEFETLSSGSEASATFDGLANKPTLSALHSSDIFKTIERYEKLLEAKEQEIVYLQKDTALAKQALQNLAFSDPLTDLGNRRAFEEDLEVALQRAPNTGENVMVVTLDLDGLKNLNDTLGHERGDSLLIAFAHAIKTSFSPFGKVYRTGGDEFMALSISIGHPKFSSIQAAVDTAISQIHQEGFSNSSVSIGIASFPQEAQSQGDLVRLSDQRMYSHKQSKRSIPTERLERQNARVMY